MARAQTPPVVTCRDCTNHGCVPCKKHGKLLAQEQAAGTLFCSLATECKTCQGALTTDCTMCVNAHVEAEMQRRKQLAREWLQKRRTDVDKLLAEHEPFAYLSAKNVELTFAIKSLTVGKEKLDTHALMHLYAERIEALRTMFLTVFELTEADLPNRFSVYMFREARDHNTIGPRVTGLGNANSVGLKSMGPEYVFSMWMDPRSIPDDEALHRNIVHMVTHLLLSQMPPAMWLGNHKHGWLDEGVAHWFEDKIGGKCTNYCFEEILLLAGSGFKGGKWRPAVRKLVDEGKGPSFATLSSLNTDQLDYEQHAFAFAYVDFLVTMHGGAKFRDLLRLVKQDKPTRDALQTVYGSSPLTIDPQFQQWVKATYSPLLPR
ncbi:MAG TPA: hypothetical protein VF384_09450 [Planctomycetota bacterium]